MAPIKILGSKAHSVNIYKNLITKVISDVQTFTLIDSVLIRK